MSYIHRQLNGLSPEVKTYSRRSPLEIEEHEVDYIGECSAMNEHRGKFVSFIKGFTKEEARCGT